MRSNRSRATVAVVCVMAVSVMSEGLGERVASGALLSRAIAGRPFGVGKVTIPLGPDAEMQCATNNFSIREANDRILYPFFSDGRLLSGLRELLSPDEGTPVPGSYTAYFLFVGDSPLEITIEAPRRESCRVVPTQQPRAYRMLLREWWREFTELETRQRKISDYPPLVETYLTAMFERRLQLGRPLENLRRMRSKSAQRTAIETMLGSEDLRQEILEETARGTRVQREGSRAVPDDIHWRGYLAAAPPDDVPVEPIAYFVPDDCFYVRFGKLGNFLWLTDLLEEYGGDVQRMTTLRGHQADYSNRIQRQLALRELPLADLLGDKFIGDLVLIGRDTFMREGAAIGVLIESKTTMVGSGIAGLRVEALKEWEKQGAKEEKIKFGEHTVSFISTPDNQLRSFYVNDGSYHLVTTSRAIVERFLQIRDDQQHLGSLGASAEFRQARVTMPLTRDDTVFVYLSAGYFQGLLSPQYWLEQHRRLQAATELELMQLAQWAYEMEKNAGLVKNGRVHTDAAVDDLIGAHVLPSTFGRRADRSRPELVAGGVVDSLRGARGAFLPVPDVPLTEATAEEVEEYGRIAEFHETCWPRMDPVMVGIRRFALDAKAGTERVDVDMRIAPFDQQKYRFIASLMGPPTTERMKTPDGTILSVDAFLRGGTLRPSVPEHHLFLGVQDSAVPLMASKGNLLGTLRLIRSAPVYVAAWPSPGWLDFLPLLPERRDYVSGYSQLPFGLWRRQWEEYAAISFHQEILEDISPKLCADECERPAQIRVMVGNIAEAKMTDWFNALAADRALRASLANTRFLNALSQQFPIPRSEARQVGERLLDCQLVCALGGEYQLVEAADGNAQSGQWRSTAWEEGIVPRVKNPQDFRAPVMDWFRGVDADVVLDNQQLQVSLHLDMQRKPTAPAVNLPIFNLFPSQKRAE
ncbi:MAG: hypothetical protein R3E01_13655 [Pirellulaceae bacterium]